MPAPLASLVIPAHNEERVIGRLLRQVTAPADGLVFETVVICNGCTDRSAAEARDADPEAIVIETPTASKHLALQRGDEVARGFPRIYIDADVEISARSLASLVQALDEPGVEAVAPRREVRTADASWLVRSYYSIWRQLPDVDAGLFGRGVLAVSHDGWRRITDRPDLLGDDLFLHEQFEAAERRVVDAAAVIVHAPRTAPDLFRRRMRAATGNRQSQRLGFSHASTQRSLAAAIRSARSPRDAADVGVFLIFTTLVRVATRLRKERPGEWMRDASSRV